MIFLISADLIWFTEMTHCLPFVPHHLENYGGHGLVGNGRGLEWAEMCKHFCKPLHHVGRKGYMAGSTVRVEGQACIKTGVMHLVSLPWCYSCSGVPNSMCTMISSSKRERVSQSPLTNLKHKIHVKVYGNIPIHYICMCVCVCVCVCVYIHIYIALPEFSFPLKCK